MELETNSPALEEGMPPSPPPESAPAPESGPAEQMPGEAAALAARPMPMASPQPQSSQLMELLAQTQRQLNELQNEKGNNELNDQMRQITAMEPSLRTLADLREQPEFKLFDRLVRSGETDLVGAFKLAFFDRISRRQTASAHQAAINAMRSKQHLAPMGGNGPGEDDLTDEIVEQYRAFNPKWTREQIRAFHHKYKRGV